jgi:hypothetical protein
VSSKISYFFSIFFFTLAKQLFKRSQAAFHIQSFIFGESELKDFNANSSCHRLKTGERKRPWVVRKTIKQVFLAGQLVASEKRFFLLRSLTGQCRN